MSTRHLEITYSSGINIHETRSVDGELQHLHIELDSQTREAIRYLNDFMMAISYVVGMTGDGFARDYEITRSTCEDLLKEFEKDKANLDHPAVKEAYEHFKVMEALARENN